MLTYVLVKCKSEKQTMMTLIQELSELGLHSLSYTSLGNFCSSCFNSLPTECHLLIAFANSLDPDLA